VPVAILVALSLTAIGGSGLGGLGALSQIVSGPRAPGSDVSVDDGDAEIGDAVTQLAASSGADDLAGGPGTVPGGQPAPGPGGSDAPSGSLPPPGGGEPPGGGDGIDPIPPGGGGGGGTPAPPAPPAPGQPGVVDGLGQAVTDVTSDTPLGPTVEDAVDGLVDVCGRLGCP